MNTPKVQEAQLSIMYQYSTNQMSKLVHKFGTLKEEGICYRLQVIKINS